MKKTSGTHLLHIVCSGLLLASAAHPAGAQQDVMRDVYRFQGSALDVEVATESPGRIRLMRGQRSRVEVAGRAPDGFTSAALGGVGVRRLTLTALASGPVDFVVSVPEDVRVRIHWEGSNRSELFGPLTRSATYAWDTLAARPAIETIGPADARRVPAGSSAPDVTPRVLDITSAHRLDRLTVHVGEAAFGLSPAHRIDAQRSGDALRFAAPEGADVAIDVPLGERMTLRLDGVDAIVVDGSDVRVLCESVLSQTLPDGRRWLTLTPVPGEGCRGDSPRRPAPTASTVRRT